MSTNREWQASAAYLYVLHLSPLALAWEYLRRHPQYRSDWVNRTETETSAARWGLEFLWDPAHDARQAQPVWLPSVAASHLRLCKSDEPSPEHVFSLWELPGRKSLLRCRSGLRLSAQLSPDTALNLALNRDLRHGCALVVGIAPHADPVATRRALGRLLPLLKRRCRSRPNTVLKRPARKAFRHLRILQALDGEAAGATHREIATAVFGAQEVWERWTHDNSELRAQLRYLLKCGHAFLDGGYRDLLIDAAATIQ